MVRSVDAKFMGHVQDGITDFHRRRFVGSKVAAQRGRESPPLVLFLNGE